MNIEEVLTELNLSPREAKVYTSLLEMGAGTPVTLARKTGLKRTTIYLDLDIHGLTAVALVTEQASLVPCPADLDI